MRCSPCDIFYPTDKHQCQVCGRDTWFIRDTSHDTDWKEQVAALRTEMLPDHLEWDYAKYPVLTEFEYAQLEKRRGLR